MSKLEIQSPIEVDMDAVLEGVARLEMSELEQFAERVMALRAQRRAGHLPPNEADLLQKINQGVPTEVRDRYEVLNEKLHQEIISPEEHQELLEIIDQIELADAERLHYLIELAQLRNMPVDTLMDQLGIRRPSYA
jgi:DNA-binding GntR family transcriptional regulator